MNIEQLLEQMQQVLQNIENEQQNIYECIDNLSLNEMAQRQGSDQSFVYYTLDKEPYSHKPHVHICVKKGEKGWQNGKPLNNGSGYLTIGSVYLDPLIDVYDAKDLEFEQIIDPKVANVKNRKIIANWLNSFTWKQNNALKCIQDYLESNQSFANRDLYMEKLKKRYE